MLLGNIHDLMQSSRVCWHGSHPAFKSGALYVTISAFALTTKASTLFVRFIVFGRRPAAVAFIAAVVRISDPSHEEVSK